MSRFGRMLAAAALAVVVAGCGEEERPLAPSANTPKVAATLSWPGVPPWALITYTRQDGLRCAALGSLTTTGPRVLGAMNADLASGLASRGRCLEGDGPVLLDVEASRGGEVQIIGGIARPGVRSLRLAGQTVRPKRDGSFLVIHADPADQLGREVEVRLRSGARTRVPLPELRVS